MAKRKETPDVLAEILGGAAEIQPPAGAPRPIVRNSSSEVSTPKPRSVPRASQPPAMKRQADAPESWEYSVISFQEYHGWHPRFRDGRELVNWSSGPLVHELIEKMSKEGWELVAASSGEHLYGVSDKRQLYFRRLKS